MFFFLYKARSINSQTVISEGTFSENDRVGHSRKVITDFEFQFRIFHPFVVRGLSERVDISRYKASVVGIVYNSRASYLEISRVSSAGQEETKHPGRGRLNERSFEGKWLHV